MVVIKIFNANDRDFNTAGNIIIEPLYCHEIKKKSLNGWYIDVEIPIKYKEYIEQDKLCVVKTKSKLKPQAFRIKDIEYTTNKIVFQARHVMFDAEDYFLLDVRPINQNGLNALNYINERTDIVSPFTMYSNVENTNTAYFIRKNLLEAWSTIEEKWNGVFDADNWDISFLVSVGNDKGETIYYRKNLEDMKIIEDWSGVCTKLYPIGKDEMMLPNKYLESETQYDIPYTRTIKFDTQLSDEEQIEENLLNELETNAINYLQENCVPKVCYEINSNISQEMEIGDIIQVKHPLCNISTEVLEYEYDAILEKVIKLVFGNYSKDVKKKFKAVTESIESIKEAVNKQQTTINNQTNLINSLNKNGYVYIDENEILILDTIPKEKAKNVWRFGLGGIGFSSNGYEGPFEVAMTMDGQINANFITTGTLAVSRIEGLANFISETEKQISNIEIEQGKITSRVESIVDTKGEAEGKLIHIEDSAEEPLVDISLHGETNQKTRSGKNKLKNTATTTTINGITFTVNSDGTVMANGTATAIAQISIGKPVVGTYKYTGCPNGGNYSNAYRMRIRNSAPPYTEYGTDIGNGAELIFESILDTDLITLTIDSGVTVNNLLFKPMISVDGGEYEPYGASPSPDFPSEIENIEGKNIFNGIYTVGTIDSSGNEQISSTALRSGYIEVKGNTNYILSSPDNASYIRTLLYDKNKTFIKTAPYYFTTTEDTKYIRFVINGTDKNTRVQLEEGTVATPYAPNNSLEVKVEGKNRLPYPYHDGTIKTINGITFTVNEDGSVTANGTATYNASFNLSGNTHDMPAGIYKLVGENELYTKTAIRGSCYKSDGTVKYFASTSDFVRIEEDDTRTNFYIVILQGETVNNVTFYPMLIPFDETDLTFEKPKSQTAYFPLAEGQKLMEGSYIDDEGIHNVRKQLVFDGTETFIEVGAVNSLYRYDIEFTDMELGYKKAICTHFTHTEETNYSNVNEVSFATHPTRTRVAFFIEFVTLDEFKASLAEQYANGTPVIVEYELANPEIDGIVPYTEEQQKAWNKIKALTTYKNITNITSDAYVKIVYMRNNGLDVYETKQNADKRYTETTEKFAETKITTDSIKDTVSTTQTTVANNYQELKGKFDDYAPKSDIITIQNSVEKIQTDTYTKTEINTKLTDGSVTKVLTKAGTFDENGLTIEENDAKVKSNLDHVGMKIMDATSGSDEDLMFAGYDEELNETIVRSKNMTVEKYFVECNIARREKYSNPILGGKGVGVFIL